MKYVLSLTLCVVCFCASLSADQFGSFSLSPAQPPFEVTEGSSAFIPFSKPNKDEFQVASCHIIAKPSDEAIRVKKKGVYFISYSVSVIQFQAGTGSSQDWNTVLVVNGTSLDNTTTMGTSIVVLGDRSSLTGQTIVFLPKNSVVQLKITNTTQGPIEVQNATISFIGID